MAVKSVQDQFKGDGKSRRLVGHIMQAIQDVEQPLSRYESDTRHRDKDLLRFSRSEPLLSSVLSSIVQRDINRSWTLTGSVNKVAKTASSLHSVNNGLGWRNFISRLSESFYATNLGFAAEVGADSRGRPTTLWSFDPTAVRLYSGQKPYLEYAPSENFDGRAKFKVGEYIHGNSMPSIEEELSNAGFCAVERSLLMARITIGLFQYHLEKLGVAPPKGIALFKGMMKEDYNDSVAEAEEEMENEDILFFKNVIAIFTNQLQAEIDLIGFSQLPDQFDLKEFVDIVMQAYALAFGYPVSEVWSISSGSFSRDGEMAVQQSQATEKGELAFSLSLQEQLQQHFIPSSVDFAFDLRNDAAELIQAEKNERAIKAITQLYGAGRVASAEQQDPLITKEQALELLAQQNIIPNEWTANLDNAVTIDLKMSREKARQNPYIVNRALLFPDEPIIEYKYVPSGIVISRDTDDLRLAQYLGEVNTPSGEYRVLFGSGDEMLRKRVF